VSDVVVVDYGAGNTRSVRAALEHIGFTSEVTCNPERVLSSERLVLPGVGSARSAMTHLNETGAAKALRDRFASGRSILGICLGLQLSMESSDEDGGVVGLGLLEGRVRRIESDRVPRLGWADVQPWGEAFYFAHSFAAQSPDVVATSDGITAVVQRDAFIGVQFHPEKSGTAGLRLLERCLTRA
jgi:imidazole glycerol phosphate synthase glutamine amidotransferase subunit